MSVGGCGRVPWNRLRSSTAELCLSLPQIENASEVLITPLEKFRKEQIGAAKVTQPLPPSCQELALQGGLGHGRRQWAALGWTRGDLAPGACLGVPSSPTAKLICQGQKTACQPK